MEDDAARLRHRGPCSRHVSAGQAGRRGATFGASAVSLDSPATAWATKGGQTLREERGSRVARGKRQGPAAGGTPAPRRVPGPAPLSVPSAYQSIVSRHRRRGKVACTGGRRLDRQSDPSIPPWLAGRAPHAAPTEPEPIRTSCQDTLSSQGLVKTGLPGRLGVPREVGAASRAAPWARASRFGPTVPLGSRHLLPEGHQADWSGPHPVQRGREPRVDRRANANGPGSKD